MIIFSVQHFKMQAVLLDDSTVKRFKMAAGKRNPYVTHPHTKFVFAFYFSLVFFDVKWNRLDWKYRLLFEWKMELRKCRVGLAKKVQFLKIIPDKFAEL